VLRYALLRILGALPTLLLVIALAFLMVRAAPGGPFDATRVLPPDIEQNIARVYHLDEPLARQFVRYLGGLLQGDLGPSYLYRDQDVSTLIAASLPASLQIGALAILLALVIGVTAGIAAALSKNGWVDRLVTGFAMAGISVPVFVVAPLMALLFGVYLDWLPVSWTGGTGVTRLVLPVIALALPQIAYIARLTRGSMISVLGSDFVRTARAQGLRTRSIVRYHALKPAMLPLLSYMGPAIAAVLAGSVVIEQVFSIPGVGQLLIRGSLNRDYPLVLGIVIFYATMVIALNLLVDLLYGLVDPRIRGR
jgi:oligopeptide transport system permease protein